MAARLEQHAERHGDIPVPAIGGAALGSELAGDSLLSADDIAARTLRNLRILTGVQMAASSTLEAIQLRVPVREELDSGPQAESTTIWEAGCVAGGQPFTAAFKLSYKAADPRPEASGLHVVYKRSPNEKEPPSLTLGLTNGLLSSINLAITKGSHRQSIGNTLRFLSDVAHRTPTIPIHLDSVLVQPAITASEAHIGVKLTDTPSLTVVQRYDSTDPGGSGYIEKSRSFVLRGNDEHFSEQTNVPESITPRTLSEAQFIAFTGALLGLIPTVKHS